MCQVVSEILQTARKPYEDMASVWLTESGIAYDNLTFAEMRAVVRAKRDKWMILPGQKYLNQVMNDGGTLIRIRYRPEIHRICIRLGLYEC